jgi:hypothetical protein
MTAVLIGPDLRREDCWSTTVALLVNPVDPRNGERTALQAVGWHHEIASAHTASRQRCSALTLRLTVLAILMFCEVPLSEIKDDLSRLLREAKKQEIVITRHASLRVC